MKHKIYYSILIGIIVILILCWNGCDRPVPDQSTIIPDTVYIDKPFPVPVIEEKAVPYEVIVYRKDTALRKKVEIEPIILGVKLALNKLEVSKIDTAGNVFTDIHDVGDNTALTIDNTGTVEVKEDKKKKRKEKLKKLVKGLEKAGLVILGILIGSQI